LSRLIAKATRLWPSIRIMMTEVRPQIAPTETRPAAQPRPISWNTDAIGASGSSSL
jgi:hypothetical protein